MMKNNKGFSLIEIIVGITIVIVAATIVLSIIISSFRISSKTTATSVIRQNGNYALSQATRMLQFADSFNTITCGGVPYNECSTVPERTGCTSININYNGALRDVTCSVSGSNEGLSTGGSSSIDINKIDVTSCSFTCKQNTGEGPVIGINLDLTTRNEVAIEKKASINFSTSIKMRNL